MSLGVNELTASIFSFHKKYEKNLGMERARAQSSTRFKARNEICRLNVPRSEGLSRTHVFRHRRLGEIHLLVESISSFVHKSQSFRTITPKCCSRLSADGPWGVTKMSL